jgi:glycosyltransferase involved in cell wall biosynthesis
MIIQNRFRWAGRIIYQDIKVKRYLFLPNSKFLSNFDKIVTSAGWHIRELKFLKFKDFNKIIHVIHHPHTETYDVLDDDFRSGAFPIIVSSKYTKNICQALGYKISDNILLGVGKKFLELEHKDSLTSVKVGFFFRNINRKNPAMILKTIESLHKIEKNIEIFVFGSGFKEEFLTFKVTSLQNLTEVDYVEQLSKMDIFVYISKVEGFGLPPLEAMAIGIPVVSSDVGAVSEFIINERDGFIVNVNGTEHDYCERIVALINDREMRASIGKLAKEKASTMTWGNVAGKYSKYLGSN